MYAYTCVPFFPPLSLSHPLTLSLSLSLLLSLSLSLSLYQWAPAYR